VSFAGRLLNGWVLALVRLVTGIDHGGCASSGGTGRGRWRRVTSDAACHASRERPFGCSSIVPSVSADEIDAPVSPQSAPGRRSRGYGTRWRPPLSTTTPSLGVHLRRTICTGTYCAYLPDPSPAGWEV
jgi:hypothetical protein